MMNWIQLACVSFILSSQLVWASAEITDINSPTAMPAVTTDLTAQMTARAPASVETETPEKAVLTEKEIPLNVDLNKKAAETTSGSARIFLTMFVMLAVVGTTYYMVRKYKLSNKINKSNTKIKVLSQHYLGPKKSLAIIHVAGESILIGVTDQNISMIKSLSLIDDEVPADVPQNFSDTLQLKTERPAGATAARTTNVEELEEEFSFSGVKDSVSKKLKSMRSLS